MATKDIKAGVEGKVVAEAIEQYLRSLFPVNTDAIPYSHYSPVYGKRTRADVERFTYETGTKQVTLALVVRYSFRDKFRAREVGSLTARLTVSGGIQNNTFDAVFDLGRAEGLINVGAATAWLKTRLSQNDVDSAAATAPPIGSPPPVTQHRPVLKYQLAGNRIGIIAEEGERLFVKEGSLNATFEELYSGAKDFQLEGNRVALLTNQNELYVKEGGLTATFVLVANNVRRFQLSGTRIAVLDTGGQLSVKEGALTAAFVTQYGPARSFHLNGNRIGLVDQNGELFVKEGGLGSQFYSQQTQVASFQLNGDRTGVLTSGGKLRVKEGPPSSGSAGWVSMFQPVKHAYLDGNRIAMIDGSDQLHVKEGGLGASFVLLSQPVAQVQLVGNRIAIMTGPGEYFMKQGGLTSTFNQPFGSDSIRGLYLTGDRQAVLTTGFELKVV